MKLLTPVKLGNTEIKNRVVSTAHAAFLNFWQPGNSGERYMAYQERRAEGGTGLIILTAMHVHHSSQIPNHYIYEPEDIAKKYAQMSTRVHRHGAKLVQQLFHFGVQGKSDPRDDWTPLWGFSGTMSQAGEISHKMTDAEIEEVIDAFANTAKICTDNGCDGVELHGTHGYLIQQSFSPFANQRDDKWGEHLFFVKELARRVRAKIGPDKVLGFRISADDFIRPEDGGLGHERLCEVAAGAIDTGVIDYLNHSEGAGNAHYARAIGSYRHALGEWLPLTRGLKEAIGSKVPVIGVGKLNTPEIAEQALQDGDCDLVAMTRQQISDPDTVKKIETGQRDRIRICNGSNQGCFDRASHPITCFHNPEVGEENRFKALDAPIEAPKKVLVIGGGPAGLKAAEIAGRRGHKVTLVEALPEVGGRLKMVQPMGPAANLLISIDWVEHELSHLDVDIKTGVTVDEAFVKAFAPDAIILATGSTTTNDVDAPSDHSIPVISTDDAAKGILNGMPIDLKGAKALVIDRRANYETALVSESLAKRGAEVTIATPYGGFGANVGTSHNVEYHESLPKLGVEFMTSTRPTDIRDGKVTLVHGITRRETVRPFDFIVAGSNPKPRDELRETLEKYAPTKLAGDVVAPRSALEAFREGDRAGRTV